MLLGQINEGEKFKILLKGEVLIDTITSKFPISSISALVENCTFVSTSLGNQKYKITISPLSPTTINAKVSVQYIENANGIKPRWITWNLTYLDSKITTKEDFVFFDNLTSVSSTPLVNDICTTNGLRLVGLGIVEGGSAAIAGNDVVFTPFEGIERGYVIYSVEDSLKATANGVIHFIKNNNNFVGNDTTKITLLNTRNHFIVLPSPDFIINNEAHKGSLAFIQNKVFSFQPTKGISGLDTIAFSDGSNSKVYIFNILNKLQNTSSVIDDKFYTPKNTPITFDVLANDLSTNFPVINYSNGLVQDTLGVFTYTPPTGFSGIKNFTYTVNYGQYQAVGKISIVIGNYNPIINHDYNFNTLKNQSLVVNYDVPLDGYTFNVLNQPQFGNVEVIENAIVGEGCNTFSSKLTLIYTPDNNYYGNDSFDIEYCVLNNPCVVYKAYIKIYDAAPDTLCHCKGPDCVWAGDMNGDGRVSVSDILALGRFIGLNGTSRNDISYPFRNGQNSDNWNFTQPNGVNIKHIDANGDGIISEADTSAISEYYAAIHSFVPEEILAIKDYPFTLVPNSTELDSGDLLVLDIVIGNNNKPVVDIFGLTFGLNIAPQMIDSASLSVLFDRSGWFVENSASLQMFRQPKDGVVNTAFTRLSSIVEDEVEGFKPIGVSGTGKIGQIVFIVEDEVEGFKTKENFITRRISTNGIEMEDVLGEKFLLPDTYIDVRINLDKKVPVPTEDKLMIYPNPATDKVLLHFNGRNEIKGYKVFDQMGSLISVVDVNAQSSEINTSSFASGIYVVQIVTTQGTITKKIMVLDRK
jgi:hypothetical protein